MNIYSIDIPDIKGIVKIFERLHMTDEDEKEGTVAFDHGNCYIYTNGAWYANMTETSHKTVNSETEMAPIFKLETDLPEYTKLKCLYCYIRTFEKGDSYLVMDIGSYEMFDKYVGVPSATKQELINTALQIISDYREDFKLFDCKEK